jgi:hypothetical protein
VGIGLEEGKIIFSDPDPPFHPPIEGKDPCVLEKAIIHKINRE